MKTRKLLLAAFVTTCILVPLGAQNLVNHAEDSAGNYHGGWHSGSNGGYGFGPWKLTAKHGEQRSYAGFFVARRQDQPDLNNITREMAFGIYANGAEFEEAVAFRSFQRPLGPGDAFSLLLEHGRIRPEADNSPPGPGSSVGVALRAGHAHAGVEDYDRGARFAFIYFQGDETYRIADGGPPEDTGIRVTEKGLELTVILTGDEHYDLQVKILETDQVYQMNGRRLGGDPDSPIESFAVFNRNGEPHDFYFEGLQVNREE